MAEEAHKTEKEQAQKTNKARELSAKIKPLYIIALILLAVSIFSLFELVKARQELKSFKVNPEEAASKEVDKLIDAVAKLIDLPKDEKPIIYTVKDTEKLKNQPFFEKAKEDDKVLIYSNNKLAIVFRPDTNKIINFAPTNIGEGQSEATTKSTEKEMQFIVLNGTTIAGLAGRYQKVITENIPSAKITSIGNYESAEVEKTFIADSSAKLTSKIDEIAKKLGIEIGTVPSSQLDPQTDFIIVVGRDKESI